MALWGHEPRLTRIFVCMPIRNGCLFGRYAQGEELCGEGVVGEKMASSLGKTSAS